jgi:hypothetical protein
MTALLLACCNPAPTCATEPVERVAVQQPRMPMSLDAGIQVMTQYKQTMAFIKPLYRDLAKRRVPGDMLAG